MALSCLLPQRESDVAFHAWLRYRVSGRSAQARPERDESAGVSESGAPRVAPPRTLALPGLGAVRQAKLLTQLELAERAGMNVASISLLETGRRKALYRTVRQLAAALDVAPEELLQVAPTSQAVKVSRKTPR